MSRIKFDIRYKGLLSMGYEAVDISNKDLDDMVFSGVFEGFNIGNAPDMNFTQCIVTRHNANWIVQECKDYIDRIFLRSYKDEEWSGWTELVVKPHSCDNPDQEIIVVERPHSHGIATPQAHGFMAAEDKAKLDSIVIEDGNIVPGQHEHEDYIQQINDLRDKTIEIEQKKADTDHNHDERYIPVLSESKPTHQNVVGQVWIQTN